jgi:hypothetical protein
MRTEHLVALVLTSHSYRSGLLPEPLKWSLFRLDFELRCITFYDRAFQPIQLIMNFFTLRQVQNPDKSYPTTPYTQRFCWPVSRVLSRTAIHLGVRSPERSSNLPRHRAGHAYVPLFDLAPGGVFPATPVTSRAVRSYRTFSPLPGLIKNQAVYSLRHFP